MILGGRRGEVPNRNFDGLFQRLTPKPMQRKKINEKKLPLMLFFLVESVESLLFPNSEGGILLFKKQFIHGFKFTIIQMETERRREELLYSRLYWTCGVARDPWPRNRLKRQDIVKLRVPRF